jgi:intracellular septation protein
MIKFLFDYLPIILFFAAYKMYGIYTATAVAIGASALQIIVYWLIYRRFETPHVITFVVLFVLGGATLFFHNPIFIKWKPTVVSWVFAIVFLIWRLVTKKTLLQKFLAKQIDIPQEIWHSLNTRWIIFFSILGAVNLYVVYNFSTNVWVNFKLFGFLGATLLFAFWQSYKIAKYVEVKT